MYFRLRHCPAVIASLLLHAVYQEVIKLFIKPSFSSIMNDYCKKYCEIHPNDPVNNFCSEKSCLVGLCPTCICDHTQMHIQARTQPQYENIRDTYTRMHEQLQDQINIITDDRDRLNSLFVAIKEKKEKFKDVLMKARTDCLQVVNQHFNELEKRWENEISSEEKKNSLHSNYRLETVSALINKQLGCLFDEIRKMNSTSFVKEIPRIEKEVLVESQQFHSRIVSELEDNEKYTPIINYTPENLREVSFSLKKLLSLQFSIPLKKYLASAQEQARLSVSNTNWKPKQVEQQKRESFNQSMVVRRVSSAEKVNAAFSYNQSPFYPVPIVLTTSYLSNPSIKTPQALANQSKMIEKSRMSGFNFGEVDMSKFSKGDRNDPSKSTLKHKKSGLTLFTAQSESESAPSEKENTRR